MSGHFTQEKIQKVKKHVKTMFNTLFIRELQILKPQQIPLYTHYNH